MTEIETRMREIAKRKGMRTQSEIEQERLKKLEANNGQEASLAPVYFYDLLNKKIVLVLMNNETIIGRLVSFNKFQVCIQTSKIKELFVFKHSIKFYHEKQNGGD